MQVIYAFAGKKKPFNPGIKCYIICSMDRNFIENRILGPDENLLAKCHEHWIHLIYGINWLIITGTIGYGISWMARYQFGTYEGAPYTNIYGVPLGYEYWWAFYLFLGVGFFLFAIEALTLMTSEYGVTDHRIIIKRGLIFVDVDEIDLGEIRSERIDHQWLGRILGYGTIMMDARFVEDVKIPAVNNPHQFLKAVHKARARLSDEIERS